VVGLKTLEKEIGGPDDYFVIRFEVGDNRAKDAKGYGTGGNTRIPMDAEARHLRSPAILPVQVLLFLSFHCTL